MTISFADRCKHTQTGIHSNREKEEQKEYGKRLSKSPHKKKQRN